MKLPFYLILYLLLLPLFVQSQSTSSFLRQTTQVVLPPNYKATQRYPAIVLMPYTGGSALMFFNKYARDIGSTTENLQERFKEFLQVYHEQENNIGQDFILILPPGAGSKRDHSWQGFAACIDRYEKKIQQDLKKMIPRYNIDSTQIIIAGVSLGGDLSWALSMRNHHLFKGAIVMGSRCSYPPKDILPSLKDKDYSFYIAMGRRESVTRLQGSRYAIQQLEKERMDYIYKEIPFLSHHRAPTWMFFEAISYSLFDQSKIKRFNPKENIGLLIQGKQLGECRTTLYMGAENTSTLARGDIQWNQESEQEEEIYVDIKVLAKNYIEIGLKDKVKISAYIDETSTGEYILQIPRQFIGKTLYEGYSTDNNSMVHGELILGEESFLSLDIKKSESGKRQEFSLISLFSLLEIKKEK